jgi:hypothetical protein
MTNQTQADRCERSLRRLGFRMTRLGRSFTIVDNSTGAIAGGPGLSLPEIERWISKFIRPKGKS